MIYLQGLVGCCGCSKTPEKPSVPSNTSTTNQPALSGRLIFHSYSCYSCNDSKLYIYDFAANTIVNISSTWTINNVMNAHFSPDGKRIVFMGIPINTNNWDIFIWSVGSTLQPTNITAAFGSTRDEDPKFSNSGNEIIFKQNGRMKEMDTLGNIVRSFTVSQAEASMPFYIKGDTAVLYSGNASSGSAAGVFKLSLFSNSIQMISALPGVEAYYPIVRDDTSFLFTRWVSTTNHNDQIYLGFLNGKAAWCLSFNEADQNFSDAYPVNSNYVILSSTKPGGKGGYDLYIADIFTGQKWSLDLYNAAINSTIHQLGAGYTNY